MLVKRVGHSLLFVPEISENPENIEDSDSNGYVYSIGGKTRENTRTKLNERYNTKTKKWEKIASLNFARSRCGTCMVNNTIYAFYGTDSYGKSVGTIE